MSPIDWDLLDKVWQNMPEIEAVWAFGSAQTGKLRKGADIDIGVLFSQKPGFDLLADLLAMLKAELNMDDIDLVVLNDASPILRFEVISGRVLFLRDKGSYAKVVSLWAREYEDEMGMLRKSLHMRKSYKIEVGSAK